MIDQTNPGENHLGKVLLLLGGAILTGIVLSTDDEKPSRGVSKSSGGFAATRKPKTISKRPKVLKIRVEAPVSATPSETRFLSEGNVRTEDRKYPDYYYTLSKGQQYKFRKKFSSQI
jgi:hypothetical protein